MRRLVVAYVSPEGFPHATASGYVPVNYDAETMEDEQKIIHLAHAALRGYLAGRSILGDFPITELETRTAEYRLVLKHVDE